MSQPLPSGHDARRISRPRQGAWFRLGRSLALPGLVGAALLTDGCVVTSPQEWIHNGFKIGPNYCQPPAPVAETWIEAKDQRTQGPPPRDGDWWTVFQDSTLNSLVCRAYQQNPNLRAVGTRILQARAQQAISVGNFFPQSQKVQGLYDYGTFAGAPPNHIDMTTFNLSWEIDFWGKYRRQMETANANLDASVENYDDALVTLLADVATNYVQYRIAQQRIKISRNNLKTQERLVKLAERQLKIGTGTALDVEQLRTLVEQTRSSIPALQIVQGQANDRLCTLLGEPPHDLEHDLGPGPDLGSRPMPDTPANVAAGIPSDLLLRRPDVRSAERQIAAQSPQIGVAESDLYPSVTIGAMIGVGDVNLGPALSSSGFLAFITPQFNWKVLNYGRIVNNVHLQEAKTQELIATYQNRVLTAAQEVQSALRGFLRSQEQVESLAHSATAAQKATKVEEQLFTSIKADVNRLFTLENTLLQSQDQLAIAQGNISLNLINVYRALGGGWELRCHEGACLAKAPADKPQDSTPPVKSLPDKRTGEEKP